MTFTEQCITIGLCALASVLTRALPFLLLSEEKPTPPMVRYLGNVLPAAVFGMLIFSGNHGLPELAGILVTAVLHLKFRQMLLSIGGGTAVYMILIQYVFIP